MAIERAHTSIVRKPWGTHDLRPWSTIVGAGEAIGELWFELADGVPEPTLLLKLLFTEEPLSIQVHPDDALARSMGFPNGKTEAWYILSTNGDGKIAVGLKNPLTVPQLRTAIGDGSILHLVKWQRVDKGDVVLVPAGTIHAIGPGLVIAEIQQRSDATFRLFDFGRSRSLDIDNAVAATKTEFPESQAGRIRLTDTRVLLVTSSHFVLELIELGAGTRWHLAVDAEVWLLVVVGGASVGVLSAFAGEAIFLVADSADIEVGPIGLTALLAYVAAGPAPMLRQIVDDHPPIRSAGMPLDRDGLSHAKSAGLLGAGA